MHLGEHNHSALTRRVYSSACLGKNIQQGWKALVNDLYGSLDIEIDDGPQFRGEILRSSVGRLELTEICTRGEVARRGRQHIAKDGNDFFLFGLAIAGTAGHEQYGRECVMAPQHFGLIYSAAPYQFRHHEAINRICLKIPAAALQARVADPHALCSIARPVLPGLSRMVADQLISMARQANDLIDTMAQVIEPHMLDLIGLLLNTSRDRTMVNGTSVRWAIHRRARAFMIESLSQPALNPELIAAGIGISTRYLHRVFADAEETVTEALMRMRLERCRDMLADPTMRPLSIKQIAYRNGFKSQSHCASAFKSRFGVTPRDIRQAALS